jgi:NurA-like 5'-3' nuclease
MSSSYERALRSKRSNKPVLIGLGIMVMGFGAIPMMMRKSDDNKNLLLQDKALTGSQIQRGAYLNSGSKDAGPDPVRVPLLVIFSC